MRKIQEIYLDYASTTPLAEEVVAEMGTLMNKNAFGNPSATDHLFGKQAYELIENARQEVASLINALPDEIIWTSGATEANNLAILGLSRFKATDSRRQIISSFAEHKSVIEPCKQLEKEGLESLLLSPNSNGSIDINEFEKAISKKTLLVSFMHINNEVGSINDIKSIAEPRYLHQTTIVDGDQTQFNENLADVSLDNPSGLWRIHFHVPIHLSQFGSLRTTQHDLECSIPILKQAGTTSWEVETYTWSVMPNVLQQDELVDSIAKELAWAANSINT